jgi:arylsulfatase A-like enzyme
LQTGRYASELNIFNNSGALPKDSQTLGKLFKESGYRTGYIGKWHMCQEEPVPKNLRKGYDYWLGANELEFTSDAYKTSLYDDEGSLLHFPGYRVDALTDCAIDFIVQERNAPFFLFLSYLEPHFQNTRDDYPAPYGYEEKYIDAWTPPDLKALPGSAERHLPGYYGVVKRLDEAFGRIYDVLISEKIRDNTIVLYASDHGCHFKTRNSEYKRSCHDASIRVPIAMTGSIFSYGGRLNKMISLVDIPPTLLDACGIDIPKDMRGSSIIPLVKRENIEWPDYVYSEICCDDELFLSLRTKRWKYCVKANLHFSECGGHAKEYKEYILYDLKADPWEMNNIVGSNSHRKVCDVLKEKLLDHLKEIGRVDFKIFNADKVVKQQFCVAADEEMQ